MKTLYEEILENQEKEIALKAEQMKKEQKLRNKEQTRDLVLKLSGGLIIAIVTVLIFKGIGTHSSTSDSAVDKNSWDNVNYGDRPHDFYPNIQTIDYGNVYFQTGTWYKFLYLNPDNSKKPFFFKSSNFKYNKFVFKDLGNGFYAVAAEKSDLIVISATQQ